MSASGTEITLAVLGVWRIAHLLHAENGPGDVVVKLRRALGTRVLGRAMDCFDCLSVWVAMPFAALVGDPWREMVLMWPALSAAAMIVNRGVFHLRPPAAALYVEDPAEEPVQGGWNVQLQQGARERVDDAGRQSGEEGGDGSHAAAAARPSSGSTIAFEYVGGTGLTVFGGATRVRYRFGGPGARVAVDARDAVSLDTVGVLKRAGR